MIEIQLDKATLPTDGQKVRWVTEETIDRAAETKEGTYIEEEHMFHVTKNNDFDHAWHVEKWEPIK